MFPHVEDMFHEKLECKLRTETKKEAVKTKMINLLTL